MTAKKPDPELTVDFKLVKIAARGSEAISAVKWPIAIVFFALAVSVILVGYYHADLIAIRAAVRAVVAFFGR